MAALSFLDLTLIVRGVIVRDVLYEVRNEMNLSFGSSPRTAAWCSR
jgi:hypothetical protein